MTAVLLFMKQDQLNLSPDKIQKIDVIISNAMASNHIPGVGLVIVHQGETIYQRGYGVRNYKTNQPITDETLFGIGSCTKSFTSMAILQLQEKGKLDINDPISKYLPITIGNKDNPILINHLMSHTSGLPNLGTLSFIISRMSMAEYPGWTPMGSVEDFYTHINDADHELIENPGEVMYYNNSGYTMLGEIITKVYGKSYEQYIEKHILNQINIRGTFDINKINQGENVITGYLISKDRKKIPEPRNFPLDNLGKSAGGLFLSINDLGNYMKLNLARGNFQEKQILDDKLIDDMQKIHIYYDLLDQDFGKTGYGFGWRISENFLGYKLVQHGGSLRVCSANISLIPELDLGIAIGINLLANLPIMKIFEIILDKKIDNRLPVIGIPQKYKELIGIYNSYRNFNSIEIFMKSNMLFVRDNGSMHQYFSDETPLIPVNQNVENMEFYYYVQPGMRARILFGKEEKGGLYVNIERYRYHKLSL